MCGLASAVTGDSPRESKRQIRRAERRIANSNRSGLALFARGMAVCVLATVAGVVVIGGLLFVTGYGSVDNLPALRTYGVSFGSDTNYFSFELVNGHVSVSHTQAQ